MSSVSKLNLSQPFTLDSSYTFDDLNELFDLVNDNFQSISTLYETVKLGQALIARNVPLEPATRVGQPVYYETGNQRFSRSRLETLQQADRVFASESSEAWGLVLEKCTADRGHIVLSGLVDVDLLESVGESQPTGKFYLTESLGALNSSPSHAIVVPVLLALGNGQVLFRPWFADTFPRYIPKYFEISSEPAGTAQTSDGTVVISSPNISVAGWLPANNAVFEGTAPAGAVFGYNWKQDAELNQSWPPLDPGVSKLWVDPGGQDSKGFQAIFSGYGWLRVTADGIWWMTNCAKQLPWDLPAFGLEHFTACPKSRDRRLVLEAMIGETSSQADTSVNSLDTRPPWLSFKGRDSDSKASTGSLDLAVIETELWQNSADDGAYALKGYAFNRFLRGPVVSGLKTTSPSVTISGGEVSNGYRFGNLKISVSPIQDVDISPTDIQLFGATTEAYDEVMAIGLPPNLDTRFVSSFVIPMVIGSGSKIRVHYWLLLPTAGSIPGQLQLKVRRFEDPGESYRSIPLSADIDLNYTAGQSLVAGQYVAVYTDEIDVEGGDMIYLEFQRKGTVDGVGNELHVLKQVASFKEV